MDEWMDCSIQDWLLQWIYFWRWPQNYNLSRIEIQGNVLFHSYASLCVEITRQCSPTGAPTIWDEMRRLGRMYLSWWSHLYGTAFPFAVSQEGLFWLGEESHCGLFPHDMHFPTLLVTFGKETGCGCHAVWATSEAAHAKTGHNLASISLKSVSLEKNCQLLLDRGLLFEQAPETPSSS